MKSLTIGILALVCITNNAKACDQALLYKKVSESMGIQVAAAEYLGSSRYKSKGDAIIYISHEDDNGNLGKKHIQFVTSVSSIKGDENLLSAGIINTETCEIEPKTIGGGSYRIKVTPFKPQ